MKKFLEKKENVATLSLPGEPFVNYRVFSFKGTSVSVHTHQPH